MEHKELDIIIPVYNTETYLERCLNSILSQTYKNFNILIIDDGSTDSSYGICEYYAKKHDNINAIHTNNRGLYCARNLGIQISESKYVGFIDSDDWIEKYMLEKLIKDAKQYNADISACNMYACKSWSVKREKNEMNDFVDSDTKVFYNDDVLKKYYKLFSVCNKIFKREIFNSIKFPEGKIFEDARTTYKLADKAKIATFNRYNGYNYFQRETGIIGTLDINKMYDRVLMWNEIYEFVSKKLPEEKEYILSRKLNAIFDALGEIKDTTIDTYYKLIDELQITNSNKNLTEEEKIKIKKYIK